MILESYIAKAMSAAQYHNLLNDLMAMGKTTGHNQSELYLGYAKINLQRMLRLEKTTELSEELKATVALIKKTYTWLIVTEGWCGDAAQNIPVFEKIEQAFPLIELRFVLRDEHPELMELYLTNGSRSIPKLICVDKETGVEIFTWGPRPAELQNLVMELKTQGVTTEEKGLQIQKWYNTDKTLSLQKEFIRLISDFLSA